MKHNEKGFTLVEIMVVLLVIGAIMAFVVPHLSNAGEKAHEKGCEANQRLIISQLENYKLEKGSYPTGANYTDIFDELIEANLLKKTPECPARGNYVFLDQNNVNITSSTFAVNVTCDHPGHEDLIE